MKCPSCGERLPDGSTFCGYCGEKIEAQPLKDTTPAQVVRVTYRKGLPGWAWVLIGMGAIVVVGLGVWIALGGLGGGSATSAIAGSWAGDITSLEPGFSDTLWLEIKADCSAGAACGTYRTRDGGCVGTLILRSSEGDGFWFEERLDAGASSSPCTSATGWQFLRPVSSDRLQYNYALVEYGEILSRGELDKR